METNQYGHGAGCRCNGEAWHDRWECPWFGAEDEHSYVPFTLDGCRVCHALLASGMLVEHMQWHEKMGHLE